MLNKHPIVAFLATRNPDRAKAFYADTLGLELLEDTRFALVFALYGTVLRIQKAPGHTPALHTALGWETSAIVRDVRVLMQRGVRFERFAGMEQDELGIWTAPTAPGAPKAMVAWFKDPDGNLLSLSGPS